MRDRSCSLPTAFLRLRRETNPRGRRAFSVRVLLFLCAASVWLGFCNCARRDSAPHLVIASSTRPLAALIRELAGPEARILVLLPPGANPHSFEPTPRIVAEGSSASLVARVGGGLDDWARPIVQEALRKGAPEIVAVTLVDSLMPAVAGDDEDEHQHSMSFDRGAGNASDPHVWLDPLSMIRFCREVSSALERIDPAHAPAYRARAAATVDSLRTLHVQMAQILAPVRGRSFVGTHNAWGYLSRRYGIRQLDVLQRVPTREPGPRRLAEIVNEAAAQGAGAVFTEIQGSSASAETLARELDLHVVRLDPEGTSDDPARDRYFDLLRWNARRIAAALSPAGARP
jgi:ABC-type Zn uptake system ZnuABC Zn-binding protein ZnuA